MSRSRLYPRGSKWVENIRKMSLNEGGKVTGLSRPTLVNIRRTGRISEQTLVKLERVADRLRTEDSVNTASFIAPRRYDPKHVWSIEQIAAARDAQMRGDFRQAVRLAEAMRTDDSAFNAYHSRIAPQMAVASRLEPAAGARGEAVWRKAQTSVVVPRSVLTSIHGSLANHGIAIGYVKQETNDEGTRVDFELTEWPLEHVRYNSTTEELETDIDSGPRVPIVHGDGRWIIFRKFAVKPWTQEACILPGSIAWAMHQHGLIDWAGATRSHGRAKVIGKLPDGTPLQNEDGSMTTKAQSYLTALQRLVDGEDSAGIAPFGSEHEFIANPSNAWQVFHEMIQNREKAFARIYLGTDAILGSIGGAPGVDIAELFKIAGTKLQGDLQAIESGLDVGLYQPWTAINVGDSRYAPSFRYVVPDIDSDRKIDQDNKNRLAFFAALKEYRATNMLVDQTVVNELAAAYHIDPPKLADIAEAAIPLTLAPTDVAKVVRVVEVRKSQGLPALGDARDQLTIEELTQSLAAPKPNPV